MTGITDRDGDGLMNLSDVLFIAGEMSFGGEPFACPSDRNVDGSPDCAVDISDILWLAGYIFLAGPPVAPCLASCQ